MGAAFSSSDTISQSPNRSRINPQSNRQPSEYRNNQRINSNISHTRRSSATIPTSSRNRYQNDFDNSLEVQIHQILDNSRNRQVQIMSENYPSTSGRMANSHSPRPFSFGGDLTLMGLGSESENESDRHSIHARLSLMPYFAAQDKKCSICKKVVPYDNYETHYIMCFTKPRVTFNDDILTEDQGECVICLVELIRGDVIARLPCLCIYHKSCIEQWFQRNQTCPSHPEFSDSSGR